MSEPERPAETPSQHPAPESPVTEVAAPVAADPAAAGGAASTPPPPPPSAAASSGAAAEAATEPRPPSRFAVWRKRLSPLVLVIAVAFLLREACDGNARRPVTVQLDFGAQASRVRQLWVDVFVGDESVAQYQRGDILGTPSFEARLSGEPAELRIELELAPLAPGGEVTRRTLTRKLSAEGGSTVTIPLSAELDE